MTSLPHQEPPPIHPQTSLPSLAPTHHLTAPEASTLYALATAAKATAYCPYSRFRVGAALVTSDGRFFSGANVENAAYPVGTCAERVLLGKAVTELAEGVVGGGGGEKGAAGEVMGRGKGKGEGEGGFGEWKRRGGGFKALAVATDVSPPASPCGMCRQFIREFCELDMPIWLFDKDGSFQVVRLEQLLPLSFGPEHLPPPV